MLFLLFFLDIIIIFQNGRVCGCHICQIYQKIGKIDKEHPRHIQIKGKFHVKGELADSKLSHLSFTYSYKSTSEIQLSLLLGTRAKEKNSQK